MRGLLLKDWYLIKKNCWSLYFMEVVFVGLSLFATSSTFVFLYPYLFAGIVPMTLYAYDERDKWNIYCAALPVSRRQYVSGKYLCGLLSITFMLLLAVSAHTVAYLVIPGRTAGYLPLLSIFAAMGFPAPALTLPLMFRFGAEKARMAYVLVIAVFGSLSAAVLGTGNLLDAVPETISLPPALVYAAAPVLYLLSWALSMAIYEKRDL